MQPHLKKLGGESSFIIGGIRQWIFPSFISSIVIAQVIHNTCFVCGGQMKDSTAFQNTNVSFNDFGSDSGNRGTTESRIGPAKQIKIKKCSQCGHSHT